MFSILLSGCQTNLEPVAIEASFRTSTPEVTANPSATAEPSPTATEKAMTLQEKVAAFAAGKIEFPSDLTPEQYKAFIKEMNDLRGSSAIWVEAVDGNKNPIVYYHDVLKNQMVILRGNYEKNKAIIEQNSTTTFVEIYTEPGTNNLQYVDPKTGEKITVPDSGGFNWQTVIDAGNLDSGIIQVPDETNIDLSAPVFQGFNMTELIVKGVDAKSIAKKSNLIPIVMLNNIPTILTENQGQYFDYECLEVMFVRTNAEGKPIFGVKVYDGGIVYFAKEGSTKMEMIFSLKTSQNKLFKKNGIYYISISPRQDLVWQEDKHATIDGLENTVSAADAYNAAVNDMLPNDANVIINSDLAIEKK